MSSQSSEDEPQPQQQYSEDPYRNFCMGLFFEASNAFKQGNIQKCFEFTDVLLEDPRMPDDIRSAALLLALEESDNPRVRLDLAIECMNRVLERMPTHPGALRMRNNLPRLQEIVRGLEDGVEAGTDPDSTPDNDGDEDLEEDAESSEEEIPEQRSLPLRRRSARLQEQSQAQNVESSEDSENV